MFKPSLYMFGRCSWSSDATHGWAWGSLNQWSFLFVSIYIPVILSIPQINVISVYYVRSLLRADMLPVPTQVFFFLIPMSQSTLWCVIQTLWPPCRQGLKAASFRLRFLGGFSFLLRLACLNQQCCTFDHNIYYASFQWRSGIYNIYQ